MSEYYPEIPLLAAARRTDPPCQRHSQTSVAAAESVTPAALNDGHRRVLEFLACRGDLGGTDEEIAAGTGLSPNTARPRRIELWRRGDVVENGTRRTRSNRSAVVWVISPASR